MYTDLIEELKHWREVRDKYRENGKEEAVQENQRCAIDLIEALREKGVDVDFDLAR
jgi:SH3-like domain-containing protein